MGRRADTDVLGDLAVPHSPDAPRPTLPRIFLAFLGLGATAFGGPAMVAHIRAMAVDRKGWLTEADFRDGVALCQAIPGATAMQSCAYVGLRLRGVRGAATGFAGFGLPAFLLMAVLSELYMRYRGLPDASLAFATLRALVVALVLHAAVSMGRTYLKGWQDAIIVPVAAVLFWIGISPVLVVLCSAALAIALPRRGAGDQKRTGMENATFPLRPLLLIAGTAILGLFAMFLLDRRLLDPSLLMLKVDLFAFGGGFSSLPLMLHEVVDVRHLMDQKTFMDGIALGQITPGPIVITATFVGFITHGVLGGLIGTASIFLPSFLLLIIAAPFFKRFNSLPVFRKGIGGVLCSFVGLLATASIKLGMVVAWDIPRAAIAAAAFIALMLRVSLPLVIIGGVLIAVAFRF
jgi:chromate transporter